VDHGLESKPMLSLAVCYVTAHLALDLVAEIDPEEAEDVRQDELRRSADDLLLGEQARAWLLGEGE
jgi:hypothetical protein